MSDRGWLVAFEGGDGSGKTTQAKLFAEKTGALLTRQAGGTPFGERVRALTLDPSAAHLSARAEVLLYMSDRAEHAAALVGPAIAEGTNVVSDRWAYSSFAYQGTRHGLSLGELREISDWSTDGLWPDVVVLLRVPVDQGLERAGRVGETDHYEDQGVILQDGVNEVYERLAAQDPDRWRVVDGTGSIETVSQRVLQAVSTLLEV